MDESIPTNMKSQAAMPAAGQADDYSATNVQVEGVDEGDQVKTDGQYIYQINHNQVQIIKAVRLNKWKSSIQSDLMTKILVRLKYILTEII